jgi:hypothetical protein
VRYKRNDQVLREAIETHSVEGMEVIVPIFGEATILEQGATGPVREIRPEETRLGGPMIFYRVKAKKPLPFTDWMVRNYPRMTYNIQMTLPEWEKTFSGRFPLLPDYQMRKLEQGGTLSIADKEYESLIQRGCIDTDGNVTCYTFWQNQVVIFREQLRRGMLVEYTLGSDEHRMSYPGSILNINKDRTVVYLELFTPVPALEMSGFIWPEGIEPGFYSEYTHALGYGTYEAFEIAEEESGEKLIPPGKWDTEVVKERRIYTLKDFMPLSIVEDLCREAYGDDPTAKIGNNSLCSAQSMIMYVVPIKIGPSGSMGIWHPLPERVIQTDAVISYEDEDEG